MNIVLSLVPDFLRAVAGVLPTFVGDHSHKAEALSSYLKAGASLIQAGEKGAEELAALTEQVKAMVADGRDPTAAEWDSLKSRSDAAHAAIQGASEVRAPDRGQPGPSTSEPSPEAEIDEPL